MNKDLVIGIRPGDFEDSRVAGDHPDRTMEVDVQLTEMLGSETFVHYDVAVPPVVTPDIEDLLADTGADASSLGDTTKFESRVSSDVAVKPGERIKLVVDAAKFHFFDPESGSRIGL
jgi:multiple sugar transport system ATP-binding protein